MYDNRLLEAFATVLSEQGFEKAGLVLGLTQSAVSQRVRQLEDQAGTILIIRDNPPRPSPTGEVLLRYFNQVRDLETETRAGLRQELAPGFQHLVIAINADSLATWFMDAVLPWLLDRAFTLEILVDDQERTLRYLRSGAACACLSAQSQGVTGCVTTHLGTMEYRLCASPAFRDRWFSQGFVAEAAAQAPIIHYNHDDQLQTQVLKGCFPGSILKPPAHYIPSTERILQAVQAGLGACMVPTVQAQPALAKGSLVELHPLARTSVPLYWHRWSLATNGLEELSQEIELQAQQLLDTGQ